MKTTEERFWDNVSKGPEDKCWLWWGPLSRGGYGYFWDGTYYKGPNGQKYQHNVGAHRWLYQHLNQELELTRKMFVCHTCDVRNCVNPNHLYLGTGTTNARDRDTRGRAKPGGVSMTSSRLKHGPTKFERAPHMSYRDMPILYIIDLGGEEFVGLRDNSGNFEEVQSLNEVSDVDLAQVEMFGPSLGLVLPCTIDILDEQGQAVAGLSVRVYNKKVGCRSIYAGPNYELTGTLLRQIPFARLIRDAAIANTVRVLQTEDGVVFGARYVEGGPGFGALHEDLRRELAAVSDRGRRRVIDDAFLRRVAGVYRDAITEGYPPARAVEELLGPTTPTNARRWIAAARRDGFLGPALARGRAGERVHVEGVST